MAQQNLARRMRRLRQTPAIRSLVQENRVTVDDLIAPLFVKADGVIEEVASMPGVFRLNLAEVVREAQTLADLGIKMVAVFPCLATKLKDATGTQALNPETLILRAIRAIKQQVPELLVMTDVALDPYTSHGHDGVLDARGVVDNDATVEILAQMAVLQAEAGADFVAPSDMMDGRVGAIRKALDAKGKIETGIIAYAAKFASAYYGPFRDAVGSAQAAGTTALDKRSYQLNPANKQEALTDALLDAAEGADVLMIKPGLPYLDILAGLRQRTSLPLAVYQVSGEYAQLQAAAERGWLDLAKTRDEALLAFKRAGADMIITYFAKSIAQARA
jgi:porphobilinogen synthase